MNARCKRRHVIALAMFLATASCSSKGDVERAEIILSNIAELTEVAIEIERANGVPSSSLGKEKLLPYFDTSEEGDLAISPHVLGKTRIAYVGGTEWYVLVKAGADRKFEYDFIRWIENNKDQITSGTLKGVALPHLYDPTNGIISDGDVVIANEGSGLPHYTEAVHYYLNRSRY